MKFIKEKMKFMKKTKFIKKKMKFINALDYDKTTLFTQSKMHL